MPIEKLLDIYLPLLLWTGLGWLLGRWLPSTVPKVIGKGLFWVGVPVGIVAFLRHAPVTWSLWIAPVIAWVAAWLGLLGAKLYLHYRRPAWSRRTRTSFFLTTMVGNTAYIGFPVSLILVGSEYFTWAVFYDLMGSTPNAYGVGVALAANTQAQENPTGSQSIPVWRSLLTTMAANPAFWSFAIGLAARDVLLPEWLELGLRGIAWGVISLALVLVGMRLSQLKSLRYLHPALVSLSLKMIAIPLLMGLLLQAFGIVGAVHQVILLQIAMPPAFATLVISEAYDLDPEMAVTTIAIGSILLLLLLPLWLWLF